MNRRLGLVLCSLLAACAREGGPRGPDVVVVLVDTLRADGLPFYGNPRDTAPFLASWAARSVVFERAWAASSWTAPSTASLFTGVYPVQHGVTLGMQTFARLKERKQELPLNRIPERLETLGELMRSCGYRTFGLADNPNIAPVMGFDSGFERFEGFDDQGAPRMLETLRAWKDEIRAARPHFVYLHFMEPHRPYLRHSPWFEDPGGDEIASDHAAYESEIRYLDDRIAEAFGLLGVDDDTLVIFVADHGEEFGDHGGRYHDTTLYSELMRVPFFVHLPGAAPRRVEENVSLIDVMPTLRALLGAPPSAQEAGLSLLELIRRGTSPGPRTLFAMRQDRFGQRMAVVRGDDKYIVFDPFDPTRHAEKRELYDLAHDPHEQHDRSEAEPQRAAELDASLREFCGRTWRLSESTSFEPSEELVKRLKELGY